MKCMSEFRTSGEVTVEMSADPGAVYDLAADVTRIGEWSPECHKAAWIDGATGPERGARFKGHNKWGINRWARVCEVLQAEPGRVFEFRTVPGRGPTNDSTTWKYEIEPGEDGCSVTESYEITDLPRSWFQPVIKRFMSHHLDMRPHMEQTLEALQTAAEKQSPVS
jgi:hypothetical protein